VQLFHATVCNPVDTGGPRRLCNAMSTTNVACDSFDAFYSGDHARCGQYLEQINSSKGAYDIKVAHNSLINDYYKSGCADPQLLLTQLTQAHERARERDKKDKCRRKRDEDEEDTYREDEDLSILRYNQALLCLQIRQHAQATFILEELFENIEPIDDFVAIKICFLLLELCLIQRRPEQAAVVLAHLEKPNAFLTVLRSERPAKGAESRASDESGDVEDSKEKSRTGNSEDASDDIAGENACEAVNSSEARVGGSSQMAGSASSETGLGHGEGSEGPLPSLTLGAFLPRHGRAPDAISRAEYRFFCLMYCARLAVALKNTKAAKKDVKSAREVLDQELRHAPLLTTGHPGGKADASRSGEIALREALHCQQNAMVVVLKAYLEYTRQNMRKAMHLLALCQFNFAESRAQSRATDDETAQKNKWKGSDDDGDDQAPSDFHPAKDEACASVFYNNLGCIHFMMRKPNLATFYFQKALQSFQPPSSATGAASPSRGGGADKDGGRHSSLLAGKLGLVSPGVAATRHWLDRRAEVAYNAGLQMLMSEKPAAALKCFEQCISVFPSWPRLWLRLAESCIEIHRQQLILAPGMAGEARNLESSMGACSSRVPSDGNSSKQQLIWSIQGRGQHRRWLLTTTRKPPVGRRTMAGDEEESSAKGEQRPAASSQSSTKRSNDADNAPDSTTREEERSSISSEAALTHAAMYLRNVLSLTAPMLPPRNGLSTGGMDGVPDDSHGSGRSGAGGSSVGAAVSGSSGGSVGAGAAVNASQDKALSAGSSSAGLRAKTGPGVPGAASKTPITSGSSAKHQACDFLECEASLLEDAALVKLAYVRLCQRDHSSALRCSRKLLEKNHLLPLGHAEGQKESQQGSKAQSAGSAGANADELEEARKHWAFQAQNLPDAAVLQGSSTKYPSSIGCAMLAVLYAAEALLLLGKPLEARVLLGSFVTLNAAPRGLELQSNVFLEVERSSSAHVVGVNGRSSREPADASCHDDVAKNLCGGQNPGSSMGGLTSPAYLFYSTGGTASQQATKEREGKAGSEKGSATKESGSAVLVSCAASELPHLGEAQCMLLTNLAALHIQDGNLEEAERSCERALQVQPCALAPLRTCVYILLRKGQHSQALQRLKQSRLEGFDVGWRPPQK